MVGDEASALRSMLQINYPMENGVVRNWTDMCHIWDYTFGPKKMNIDPTDTKVTLSLSCETDFLFEKKFFRSQANTFHTSFPPRQKL